MKLHHFACSAILAAASLLVAEQSAHAQRTWHHVTTGNGHGFQVFDAQKNRITQFLEHPYRFLKKNATDDKREGPGRRNLAFDVYFGVRAGAGSGWLGDANAGDPEYLDQTHIIHVPTPIAGVTADAFYFSPFGIERNVMVGVLHAAGASDGYALFNFHMGNPGGSAGTEPDANGESTRVLGTGAERIVIETGAGGGAMIYVPIGGADRESCSNVYNQGKAGADLADNPTCGVGNDITVGFQKKLGADGWMGFASAFIENAGEADTVANEIKQWVAGRAPEKVLTDAKAEFEGWRKAPPAGTTLCSDDEKKVWRQGEATLRMGQVREANTATRKNHGMILASLPIGEWHTGWVRDATYAIVALARSGHHAEAKAALDFFLNAEPVGKYTSYVKNKPYRISVTRYFGTGEEETDWNQDGPNIEIDGWGLVLWAARQYVSMSKDSAWLNSQTRDGTVWEALTRGIADPLEGNLESNGVVAADASIWEVHEAKKKHFAYTTLTAARGFCDMAAMAQAGNKGAGTVKKYQDLEKKVREGFISAFQDPQQALAGSLEELGQSNYIDAAVAEAFTWNILRDYKGPMAKATLSLLERMRVESGGYKRNDDGLSSYDNNEWILVDFRIANAYRRAGDGAKADGIVAKVVEKASKNFYLLPELYNAVASDGQVGKYTGSIPMVGYGGGAYMMTVLDRSGGELAEVSDCADDTGAKLPKIECSSISTNPGAGENGGGPGGENGGGANAGGVPGGEEIPFVNACLCRTTGGRWKLTPMGVVIVIGTPLLLLIRRRRRRQ